MSSRESICQFCLKRAQKQSLERPGDPVAEARLQLVSKPQTIEQKMSGPNAKNPNRAFWVCTLSDEADDATGFLKSHFLGFVDAKVFTPTAIGGQKRKEPEGVPAQALAQVASTSVNMDEVHKKLDTHQQIMIDLMQKVEEMHKHILGGDSKSE